MGLLYPELLLLALPAAWAWWRWRDPQPITHAVRALALALLCLALAAPYLRTAAEGRDLIVVVDRSRSQPAGSDAQALELIAMAEGARTRNDRVGVIAFGAAPVLEQIPSASARFGGFAREVDRDGSEVAAALATALEAIPRGRAGSLLLLSDGEAQGAPPADVARRAAARGIRIDVRATPRPAEPDLSIERLELPDDVAVGEPFQFSVWVRADARVESDFSLDRAGARLSSGRRVFERGLNRVVFRDVLATPGAAVYTVALGAADDRVPENNRGQGALHVHGSPVLLVVNEDGAADTLVLALRAAGLDVQVAAPEAAPLDRVGLTAFRAVILENVAASRVGRGMTALRDFVVERGGGLLLTGGKASYGIGGWYRSPLDPLLPVSMEMRQEHRKQAVAIAIALDRSGSMAAPAGGGLQKMDLANLGTVATIELLSPMDAVAVIAVDSAAHVVASLRPVDDPVALCAQVRKIESMGGGIFTHTALVAALSELEHAEQQNRHVVLFADAADAEEHEGCVELVTQALAAGVTLSVIALGTESDSDAVFLKEIAAAGGGDAHFTTDPAELPRLFALDTLKVARATFVEEPTGVALLPDLFAMGEIPGGAFPNLPGYNLTWLRPGATAGAVTTDDYAAPILAFHQQALGRVAALPAQIGGQFGQELVAWPGFATLAVTLARWLVGQEEPEALFASVQREGRSAVIAVELDRSIEVAPDTSLLEARLQQPDGRVLAVPLEQVGDDRFEARVPLQQAGVALGTIRLAGNRHLTLPPLALPYSPEFERALDPEAGERLLREVARSSGGLVAPAAADLFRGDRSGQATRVIARELALAAIVVLLLEIAGRRLALWGALRWPASVRAWRARRVAQEPSSASPAAMPTPPTPTAPSVAPAGAPPASAPPPASPSPAVPPPAADLRAAIDRAKRAAGKQLDR